MNVQAPSEIVNEQAAVRRSSSVSSQGSKEGVGDPANPLMRLVDAALAPGPVKEAVVTDSASSEKEDDRASESQESKPVLEEAKVIRGTVQDLVARQEKKVTFAEYLMEVLNDEANHDVLQWMPCGTQFTITNHRKFTMERMPSLFKIRNMSSFVRKLTRWGFSRVHEKETGNSDIFKHDFFLRDKPELCKKIRCVNRAASSSVQNKPGMLPHGMSQGMMHHNMPPNNMRHNSMSHGGMRHNSMSHGGMNMSHNMHSIPHHQQHHHDQSQHMGHEIMGNMSESSMRRKMSMGGDSIDMHMLSPRRSMGHGPPYLPGRSPHSNSYSSTRYHQTPGTAHHSTPRVSPEYEKEMIAGDSSSFRPRPPGPPQVYSPGIGRSLSAAAEYELEQVLMERQRARMYRDQHHTPGSPPPRGVSPSALMGSGSERSLGSSGPVSERGGGRYDAVHSVPSSSSNSVVNAALETLQREGGGDLDMSPREAMLRAVLHKRQQQRHHHRSNHRNVQPSYPAVGTEGGSSNRHSSSAPYYR